ncbi:hypothetical protein HPB48_002610 [Haemaphysalis longicornis]|uniref:Inositol hexakisphosphate and diphosphoinositol-pentakisphosphate kinase n=1 Tax=Haemaphysalis longicornis TaxID=44386 RepID=A0A9J6G3T1_HAELO|nr:hypothetical protein HPB48_002610 [Haemaphysalis longicornis]
MSYNELEQGYLGLTSQPLFYIGDDCSGYINWNKIEKQPVEEWPLCDCLVSFHSKGFPLNKAIEYAELRNPFTVNDLFMQYDIQDRMFVCVSLLQKRLFIVFATPAFSIEGPCRNFFYEGRYRLVINRSLALNGFSKTSCQGRPHVDFVFSFPSFQIGSRSSVYSPESRVRKTGSFIYEEFMPTDGTDVKVNKCTFRCYTVGPDYAHAEARKSPALDGKVERDKEGKEQTVCGFDLLRANGKSYVCDVNGFSFVKNSMKYYDDCAKILGNMILRELAPQLHIPWSMPFQLDDPPIVPTTFGKMMELRCVIAVIRHGDRTPKQKMKMEVKHPKFFELFEHYGGFKDGCIKLKKPKQLQEILDISRFLLSEIEHKSDPEVEENKAKLEQLKSVLEMYGHFSGINRKVQLKYQPKGRPRHSSSDEDYPREPSLVLILKWGGELTPAGRVQAEELGRVFRCMYPGGQGEYAGTRGLGLLRLHSTFRHDLKIYASDEGRVQMTAAAFAKARAPICPSGANTIGCCFTLWMVCAVWCRCVFRSGCLVKQRLHEAFQVDHDFTEEDFEKLNPTRARSIQNALQFIKNPVKACQHEYDMTQGGPLYHGETWELMQRRWAKLEKDFQLKSGKFDISKIPDVYDCIKYDLQHNQHTLQFPHAQELYLYAKALADVVIPQEYGLTLQEKLTIGLGICTPLLKKIRADLHRNIDPAADETESVNRLNPQYSHGVSSPGRHVRTRLYFTSESHIHSLLTVLRYGGLLDETKDEQWRRAMEYVNAVTELNYMTQIVIMLYEDPTKDQQSEERFHVELHFSPGVVCCVQKNLPPGPGFRPQSRSGPCGEKPGCIEEEEDELTLEEEGKYDEVWSDHESPTILEDGNPKTHASPPETSVPVVPLFLSSQPIPIGKVLQCMAAGEAMEVHAKAVRTTPKPAATHTVAPAKAPGEERLKLYPIMRCNSDSQRPRSLDSDAAEPPKVDKGKKYPRHLSTMGSKGESIKLAERMFQHRHSVPGQMSSYLRICSVADLSKVFGSSGSLFSTAVISGSSSAPDLKNLFPSAVADGLVSVPSIRPLETLHNALSLHQLDQFLGKVTSATYRLLLSSVPKGPAPFGSSQFSALPVASPSSSMIWSGPPSFVSSSGPSTPTSSTLDIWTRLRQMNENESSTAESSGTTSRNSYSTPPSPHDSRYYNSSL